jgi:cytosine/adenosine deaminase-related metal-dependent hydrolase
LLCATLPGDEIVEALLSCSRALVGVAARSPASVNDDVTRLCDRLTRKRLVTRSHRGDNRREVVVEVTATGAELVAPR